MDSGRPGRQGDRQPELNTTPHPGAAPSTSLRRHEVRQVGEQRCTVVMQHVVGLDRITGPGRIPEFMTPAAGWGAASKASESHPWASARPGYPVRRTPCRFEATLAQLQR